MIPEIDEQLFMKQVLESLDHFHNPAPHHYRQIKKRMLSEKLPTNFLMRKGKNISSIESVLNLDMLSCNKKLLVVRSADRRQIVKNRSKIKLSSLASQRKTTVNIRLTAKSKTSHIEQDVTIALKIAENELFELNQKENPAISYKVKEFIRDALCPSLLKTSDDVYEIAKSSTSELLILSLSGAISLPIQPVFFAAAAILLARVSIAAICKGNNQSASK